MEQNSKNESVYISIDDEEQAKLRPQKRPKVDPEDASRSSLIQHTQTIIRKSKDSYIDSEEDRKISRRCNKELEEFSSDGSKVEVSLVNAELWKELCEIGNEMKVHFQPK